MLRIWAYSVAILGVGLAVALAQPPADGGTEGQEWKQFLPAAAFKEIVGRELKTIEPVIGKDDERDIRKGKAAALMIVASTLTAKETDKQDPVLLRANALGLALMLGDKSMTKEARELVDAMAKGKARLMSGKPINFRKYVPKTYDLMVMYMGKGKGGDGLHPDIQALSSRLQGGEEYIENLFAYLGKKPLAEAKVKKGAKELELVGYRTAVSAELIRAYAPKNKTKKRDPELWLQTSNAMREQALALAAAATKYDAVGIQKSSSGILDACVKCHKMFQ